MVTLLLSLVAVSALVVAVTRSARLDVELATQAAGAGRQPEAPLYEGKIVRRHAPLWRRLIDLVLLVAIWLFIGLAITAVLGGALAGMALLLQEVLT
ncbi:MAG: hypothetical protein AAFZ07_28170 [Actinomycetota bacterium]